MDKLRVYELLGAKQFQKFVIYIEKIKFSLLKPFSKPIVNILEKRIDRKLNKMLKKEKDEQKQERIISYFKREKLQLRIEFNTEKNRNYHLNFLNPKETMEYLKINKSIHEKGIISNFLLMASLGISMILFNGIIIPIIWALLFLQIIEVLINFECINLQNYNITKIENKIEVLTKAKDRKMKRKVDKYGEIAPKLSSLLNEGMELPKKEEIVSSLTSKEQLEQMKILLEEIINDRTDKYERKKKL